jgi:hypothetical protein
MLCYFLREGHIVGVEILPPGLSDEDAMRLPGFTGCL